MWLRQPSRSAPTIPEVSTDIRSGKPKWLCNLQPRAWTRAVIAAKRSAFNPACAQRLSRGMYFGELP